jgi:hypothetical protein
MAIPRPHVPPKLRGYIEGLGPYQSLALLAVPTSLVEPLKLVAVAVAGDGHRITGTVMIIVAYATTLLLVERLFSIVKTKIVDTALVRSAVVLGHHGSWKAVWTLSFGLKTKSPRADGGSSTFEDVPRYLACALKAMKRFNRTKKGWMTSSAKPWVNSQLGLVDVIAVRVGIV